MTRRNDYRRRGSMYITVLGVSMIVTVIGLAALTASRIERRAVADSGDFAQARLNAQTAIQMGFATILGDANWRANNPNGAWTTNKPFSSGFWSLNGVDPTDANLANSVSDPVVLTGTGLSGDARYALQVTLTPDIQPLTCLETSLHAGNDIILQLAATVRGSQIISANNTIQAISMATVFPNMEAVNGFLGIINPGVQTTPVPARGVPDVLDVFTYYNTNGTTINTAAIPIGGSGSPTIADALISPASNPYGITTDPQGIYVIDAGGLNLVIENSRIVGTIVVLNANIVTLRKSVYWESSVANFPALLVQGSLVVSLVSQDLVESTTNFNPMGTPYLGATDIQINDRYPSVLQGLVYASNALSTTNNPSFNGVVVVGGTATLANTTSLRYQSSYFFDPPPGFRKPPTMVVAPGSWQRVVN